MEITKDMFIGELIRKKPETIEILMQYGMGCVGCPSAQMESLEEVTNSYCRSINCSNRHKGLWVYNMLTASHVHKEHGVIAISYPTSFELLETRKAI